MTTKLEPNLSAAERATLRLRGLYERFGYKKYQIGQFEEYGLYLQFKRFLTGGRMLSFTDLDGRLLALKPDVTLSIAKNARLDDGAVKAYYIENVYRESVSSGTMKEIRQMGLEYLGGEGGYAQAEVLALASETLEAIGPACVLDVSHMGFVVGLFDALGLDGDAQTQVLDSLSTRSAHGVEAAARAAGVGPVGVGVLCELCGLSGTFDETMIRARGLCLNGRMTAALDELEETVRAVGRADSLRLDFTLQGDMEYYDGLMMAGYLDGVPKAVLSGGRYDGLMKKLGRDVSAVGFALYLDELKRLPGEQPALDVDALVLAPRDADPEGLLSAVRTLTDEGLRVRVEAEQPPRLRWAKRYRYEKGALTEC